MIIPFAKFFSSILIGLAVSAATSAAPVLGVNQVDAPISAPINICGIAIAIFGEQTAGSYVRAKPMEYSDYVKYRRRHHQGATVIYGSEHGPREVENPCCVIWRICLQALTGVRR
ncbi:hypothetical protein BGZ76_008725 [Entomortierella beljakovae]|nr:hypothetical protein BGZ76_008725 [Entomortierella beljakovae]